MVKRSGLGRGLGALLGDVSEDMLADASEDTPRELPIEAVRPNADQPRQRFDEDELASLTDSIRRNGILQPIVVRKKDDGYQIVAGERRYQAARRAGLAQVPVVVREVSDEELLQLALIENLQRSDLDPLEEALAYQSLIEHNGVTQTELAEVLSKSRSSISNALRLLELPDEVLELLSTGALSAGHARAILMVAGDEERCALARKVVRDGLSVRQTETVAPLFSVKTDPVSKKVGSPQPYKDAAKRLRGMLGTKVSVRTVRGKHKIEIEFSDEDELERLVRRMTGGPDALD